ncbi:MAG TPA: hypothetical protein VHL98_00600 [Microvirga sp.]|jgi:hypothetical protein|nr:hypothetical protein [Microvirga sp.]
MIGIVLKPMAVAVACAGLSGCMGLGLGTTSAGEPDPAIVQSADESGFAGPEDDSDLREYAPWRGPAQQAAGRADATTAPRTPDVRVASARRGVVDASAAPEPFPQDPKELERWLELRRRNAAEIHRTHMDRIRTMEQRSQAAVTGICSGC